MIETSSLPLTDAANLPAGARAVLAYWLGDVPPSNASALENRALWFTKSDAADREIAHQFGDHVEEAKAGELDHWAQTAEGTLALLIVLDQFTRNIWRGKPESFSGDEKALAASDPHVAKTDEILNTFSRYPLKTLITLTKTGPWKNNYKEGEITIIPAEDIQNYFKRH